MTVKCLKCGLYSSSELNLVDRKICRFCGSEEHIEGEYNKLKKIKIPEMWKVVSERIDRNIYPKLTKIKR